MRLEGELGKMDSEKEDSCPVGLSQESDLRD